MGNGNPTLLLFIVEEVGMEIVWFYIEVNSVLFQNINSEKGFYILREFSDQDPKLRKGAVLCLGLTNLGILEILPVVVLLQTQAWLGRKEPPD